MVEKLMGGDRHAIRRMVNREHVGTPTEKLEERILRKLRRQNELSAGVEAEVREIVRERHAENRKIYRMVMG